MTPVSLLLTRRRKEKEGGQKLHFCLPWKVFYIREKSSCSRSDRPWLRHGKEEREKAGELTLELITALTWPARKVEGMAIMGGIFAHTACLWEDL